MIFEQTGTVNFTAFNKGKQLVLDDQGNLWQVDGWFMNKGEREAIELPMTPENWEYVDFVTVWCDIDGQRHWATVFPDDFKGETIRTDN